MICIKSNNVFGYTETSKYSMMMIKKIKPDKKLWDGKTASGFEVIGISILPLATASSDGIFVS